MGDGKTVIDDCALPIVDPAIVAIYASPVCQNSFVNWNGPQAVHKAMKFAEAVMSIQHCDASYTGDLQRFLTPLFLFPVCTSQLLIEPIHRVV